VVVSVDYGIKKDHDTDEEKVDSDDKGTVFLFVKVFQSED
jgi:hypothetical protein